LVGYDVYGEWRYEMKNVKVIRIGLGEVVSNWGTYEGQYAVFLEPVAEHGIPGEEAPAHLTAADSVKDESTIIQFYSQEGARVLIEDIQSALNAAVGRSSNKPKHVRVESEQP
jgi:hypothetical protein